MVDVVDPLVTDTIWIGQTNHLNEKEVASVLTPEMKDILAKVQSVENTMKTYYDLKDNLKIRWKREVNEIIEKELK